jgi:hypothetical protein
MRSLLWSYLGSRRFPREMSTFEVRRFFTLSSDDRHVLRRRFRSRSQLRLIEMRIAEIWNWAHAVARSMDDTEVSDAYYRERSRVLLAPWRPGARQARRSRAAQVREHLSANARRVRPLLKTSRSAKQYSEQVFTPKHWSQSSVAHPSCLEAD